jgi:hypothetical protein
MKGKPFNETKFGKLLTTLPKYKELVGKIPVAGPILAIILDQIKKDPDVPEPVKAELIKLAQDHEKDMYALEIEDRKDARNMYNHDNSLQRVFAIAFLAGYLIVTFAAGWMVYVISVDSIHLPDWAIGFVGTIWGGMSAKVSTITDFLFGSSYKTSTSPETQPKQ